MHSGFHGIISFMEKEPWGKVREPSLLLSNHPSLWRTLGLLEDISRFSSNGNNEVVVVMDAAWLRIARSKYEFYGIPVDVKGNIDKSGGNLSVYLRSMLMRTFGELSGAYDGALRGVEVVRQMRDMLDLGVSVFVFPAGIGVARGKWRWGVGCLTRGIYEDGKEEEVGLGLIFVDGKYTLLPFSRMVDLYGRDLVEGAENDNELALRMQKVYEELLMDI